MFTGIIQGIGQVVSVVDKGNFRTHVIKLPPHMTTDLKIGASIANDGCCLTIIDIQGDQVTFDLIQETLALTHLGQLKVNDWVNLERAAKFGDEIGGHLMSGHIICTAEIVNIIQSPNNRQIILKVPTKQINYILPKGFIGIDGISLTVGEVCDDTFAVHLIPETLARTTLGDKKVGDRVNIEIDSQTQAVVDTVERVLVNRL